MPHLPVVSSVTTALVWAHGSMKLVGTVPITIVGMRVGENAKCGLLVLEHCRCLHIPARVCAGGSDQQQLAYVCVCVGACMSVLHSSLHSGSIML